MLVWVWTTKEQERRQQAAKGGLTKYLKWELISRQNAMIVPFLRYMWQVLQGPIVWEITDSHPSTHGDLWNVKCCLLFQRPRGIVWILGINCLLNDLLFYFACQSGWAAAMGNCGWLARYILWHVGNGLLDNKDIQKWWNLRLYFFLENFSLESDCGTLFFQFLARCEMLWSWPLPQLSCYCPYSPSSI